MNSINALFAALVVLSTPAFAQFSFDAATGTCLNAAGERGLNAGVRGACGDLSNQNLEGVDFGRADLRGARFDGANLRGASFQGAQLDRATFVRADLSKAVLTGAHLDGASLSGARLVASHLEHATLTGAMLDGADVRNACLYRTTFAGADLRTAQFSQQRSMLDGARWAQAVVQSNTLPFTPAELVRHQVEVRDGVRIVAR